MHGRVAHAGWSPPGELAPASGRGGDCLAGLPGMRLLDSLAVDGAGNVCVATLLDGGITVIAPDGEIVEFLATDDPMTTNICFGGPDGTTAFITLSATGRLVRTEWPRPGTPCTAPRQLRRRRRHRPVKRAGRRSRNAATPSRWSSEWKHSCNSVAVRRTWSSIVRAIPGRRDAWCGRRRTATRCR